MKSLRILILLFLNASLIAQGNIYKTLVPVKCDSLIKANEYNPNFVIMDVRTPAEYIPQHLEGAINRNYYDSDFDEQLDSLDHNKIYLIHCHSGSRSGRTFKKMKNKKFKEVYNMQGGILFWKSSSLPTVSTFKPRIMLVTDSISPEKKVKLGQTDTIKITVTNRANDTLKYTGFTSLTNTEFSTDFDIKKVQLGAEDYSFNIYYHPVDTNRDTLVFSLESNGGNQNIHIIRNGYNALQTYEIFAGEIKVYPNPVVDILNIEKKINSDLKVLILDCFGNTVYNSSLTEQKTSLNIKWLRKGVYFVKIFNNEFLLTRKILIEF